MTCTPRHDDNRVHRGTASWVAAVRELVALRRDEAIADAAEKDAAAEELHRVFRDRSTSVSGAPATP